MKVKELLDAEGYDYKYMRLTVEDSYLLVTSRLFWGMMSKIVQCTDFSSVGCAEDSLDIRTLRE